MRFTTQQAALADALAWSATTLPRRPDSPTMGGIRLSTAGRRLELAARDDEGAHVAELEVENALPGAVLTPGPFLRSIVSSLPAGEVTLEAGEGRIKITAGRSSYWAPSLVAEAWPTEADALEGLGELEGERLRAMLSSVRHPVDESSPWGEITGIRLEASAGELRLVGASRQVVEVARASWPGRDFGATLPARRLSDALAGIPGPARLATAGSLFGISGEGRTALLRTYAGTFPPYGRYLRTPADDASWIEADADELRAALRRISLVLSEPELGVLLEADADEIRIAARSDASNANQGEERLEAEASEPARLAVRARYLTDALGVLSGGRVRLGLGGRGRPIMVRAAEVEVEDYVAVIMPMQEPAYLAERGAA